MSAARGLEKNQMRVEPRYYKFIWYLTKLQLKQRYHGSILGFFWTLINPVIMLGVFSFVFTKVLLVPIERFPLFMLAGLLPWNFFTASLLTGINSYNQYCDLALSLPVPPIVYPLTVVFAQLINFVLILGLLFPLFLAYLPNYSVLWFLPLLLLNLCLFTAALTLFGASAALYFRDLPPLLEVGLIILFYATPIFYPLEMIPANYLDIYMLNPLAVLINDFRAVILSGNYPDIWGNLYVVFISALLFKFAGVIIKTLPSRLYLLARV